MLLSLRLSDRSIEHDVMYYSKGTHRCQVVAIIPLILHLPHRLQISLHGVHARAEVLRSVLHSAACSQLWNHLSDQENEGKISYLSLINVKHHGPNCLQLRYTDVLKNEWHFCSKTVPHSYRKLVSSLKIMWFVRVGACEDHCSYRVRMHAAVCRPTTLSPPSLREVLRWE